MFEYLRSDAASGQWEVAEAALFVMAAVARMILPSENDVVPQVSEWTSWSHDSNHELANSPFL